MSLVRRNYLSRLAREGMQTCFYQRDVSLLCRIVFTRDWIKKPAMQVCLLTRLSEGDAELLIGETSLPDTFYLALGQMEYLIGCQVVGRQDRTYRLVFLRELPPAFVNRLARITSPFKSLGDLGQVGIEPHHAPEHRCNWPRYFRREEARQVG